MEPDQQPSLLSALEGVQNPEPKTEVAPEPAVPETPLSPYAQNYLKGVPEDQHPLVIEHIKRWDAGFTQHTQKLHNDYKAQLDKWSSLGDPNDVQMRVQLANELIADPDAFVDMLQREGYLTRAQAAQARDQLQVEEDPYEGLPPAIVEKLKKLDQLEGNFGKVEKALGGIAQHLSSQQLAAKQAEEDRALEAYLGSLKQQHGEFDEGLVLRLMASGMSGEDAVGAIKNLSQAAINQNAAPKPPTVLSGSGPTITQDPAKMSEAERKASLLQRLG